MILTFHYFKIFSCQKSIFNILNEDCKVSISKWEELWFSLCLIKLLLHLYTTPELLYSFNSYLLPTIPRDCSTTLLLRFEIVLVLNIYAFIEVWHAECNAMQQRRKSPCESGPQMVSFTFRKHTSVYIYLQNQNTGKQNMELQINSLAFDRVWTAGRNNWCAISLSADLVSK